jgi:hypothetical protein
VSPGVELDGVIDRSSLRPGACDHCDKIRDRKDIYLVRHEDGRQLQVGSSCIKDFLGWSALPCFISGEDVESEAFAPSASGRWVDFSVEDVLAIAWALIKRDGFKPASFDNSTKWAVLTVLDPRGDDQKRFAREARVLVDEARKQAGDIRAAVLAMDASRSEYLTNLQVCLRANFVTARGFGLVVSAPSAWAKSVERDLTRKAEKSAVCNEYVGTVKDKVELTVTVSSIRPVDNGYGVSYLYTMTDQAGHVFKWFSSSRALGDEVTGKPVVIKGTVKGHELYNEVKQTMLTRCKVV